MASTDQIVDTEHRYRMSQMILECFLEIEEIEYPDRVYNILREYLVNSGLVYGDLVFLDETMCLLLEIDEPKVMLTFDLIKRLINHHFEEQMPKQVSGFHREVNISPALETFMGLEPGTKQSRIDVTKFIVEYIKANGLREKGSKSFKLDDKLADLFQMNKEEQTLDFVTVQQRLASHFLKN